MYRLELHNKPAIYNEIQTVFSNLPIAIGDFYRFLAFKGNLQNVKFDGESLFIKGLKKPRAQGFMDFDRSADYSGAELSFVYCTQIPEFLSSRF